MEDDEAFQKLTGDFNSILVRAKISALKVLAQVSMPNVFHRDEDDIWILIPAEELNKEILALVMKPVSITLSRILDPRINSVTSGQRICRILDIGAYLSHF